MSHRKQKGRKLAGTTLGKAEKAGKATLLIRQTATNLLFLQQTVFSFFVWGEGVDLCSCVLLLPTALLLFFINYMLTMPCGPRRRGRRKVHPGVWDFVTLVIENSKRALLFFSISFTPGQN